MASSEPADKRIVTDDLERSLSTGRITVFEADVIARFFAATPSCDWPITGLQQRMQDLNAPGRGNTSASPKLPT